MNGLTQKLALALACAGVLSAAEKSGEPATVSRTVTYHETDIVPIATEIRWTPDDDRLAKKTSADPDF